MSEEAIRTAYSETDRRFMALVRDSFEDSPHLATVGACSATAIVTPTALWVANVGDCRAVLGQVGEGCLLSVHRDDVGMGMSWERLRARKQD